MLSEVWFPLLAFLCVAWITWIFRRVNPRLPPGPLGLPIVGNLPFMGSELQSYFAELTRTYGPLVSLRLGSKLGIVVGSASVAKEILKDLDANFANRDPPAAGKEATYGGMDIAWRSWGPEWRMLRKICVHEMLGSKPLDALYFLRKHEVHQTMMHLREHEGSVVNVGEQMFLTSMNVITSMLWGKTIKGEEQERLGAQFRSVVADITILVGTPNVSDFFPWLERFDLQGIRKKAREATKRLDEIFEEMIDHHRRTKNYDHDKDFLRSLLELTTKGGSKMLLSMVELKALLMDMVVGGTDTTSNTVEFAMAEMMKAPQVMKKAQQELESVVGIGNPVEENHIHKLPYLQAIMKETLRLHPVAPLLIPHRSSESCIIRGYTIPKSSRVFINVWGIHRDPSIWVDPLTFKPERFLDDKYDFRGSNFNYLPFGSGRRICVGVLLAERLVITFLASLLHSFDWKLPKGVEDVDVSEKFGLSLKTRTQQLFVPSRRS